jgi:hypothetical protein
MLEEHPWNWQISKPAQPGPRSPRRNRSTSIYLPSFAVLAAVLLIGIIYAVTFEETAIAYLPPRNNRSKCLSP